MKISKLSLDDKEMIKELFVSVFTKEPWNDDWSDETQLDNYIVDLIGNSNSLTLGYFDEDNLVAVAMGHIKHWYEGTEYYIDELCVKTDRQGHGIGGSFISAIEAYLVGIDIRVIFLLTDRDVPAYSFYKSHSFKELEGNVAFAKRI